MALRQNRLGFVWRSLFIMQLFSIMTDFMVRQRLILERGEFRGGASLKDEL